MSVVFIKALWCYISAMIAAKEPSVQQFGKILSEWYAQHKRDLPWRNTHDPYLIWVSEIMLQQTQVDRVKDYYARFLKRFPHVEDLASASWEEVLEQWRGLGYYRRARNLHKAAGVIVNEHGGKFPRTYEGLQKLPGVGSYTAAAIAGFAFGEKVPALDTNISRIFERIFKEKWTALKPGEKFLFAQKYMGDLSARDFNYGLMDLGSLVCTARVAKCENCPFEEFCCDGEAHVSAPSGSRMARGLTFADKPKNSKRGYKAGEAQDSLKVAAGVLIHNGKILIAKRPKGKPLAGLWEFPGGKLEAREDERTCLKREFMEELGIEVSVRPAFYKTDTEHDGVAIRLSFHRCNLLLGEPKALENQELRWVGVSELDAFEFPRANDEVVSLLKEKKAMFYG